MKRGFTDEELAHAIVLRRMGIRWHTIARALGRRSSTGIRRRLDSAFRRESNQYSAVWMKMAREE
jgi:hypothetical protein